MEMTTGRRQGWHRRNNQRLLDADTVPAVIAQVFHLSLKAVSLTVQASCSSEASDSSS